MDGFIINDIHSDLSLYVFARTAMVCLCLDLAFPLGYTVFGEN